MKKSLIIIAVTIFGLTTMQANEQRDPTKDQLLEELFQTTNLYNMVPSLVKSIIITYKKKITNIPESYWDNLERSMDYSGFIQDAKKIYGRNYSEAELQEIIDAYNTKDLENYKLKSKRVEQELYALGNAFGKKAALDIVNKLQQYKN